MSNFILPHRLLERQNLICTELLSHSIHICVSGIKCELSLLTATFCIIALIFHYTMPCSTWCFAYFCVIFGWYFFSPQKRIYNTMKIFPEVFFKSTYPSVMKFTANEYTKALQIKCLLYSNFKPKLNHN